MMNFEKAHKMKIIEEGQEKYYGTKNANEDQQKYESKVKKFLEYCNIFKKSLISQKNEIKNAKHVRAYFNGSFRDYYRKSNKSSMFSRTAKMLKKMDKKLEKLGEMELSEKGAVAKIRDAFEYRREMPKDGLIKRSAIDDKAVYGFFNGTLPGIIENLSKDIQQNATEDSIDFIEESLKNAKFENKFAVIQNKFQEITNDLGEIKSKQSKYEDDEKSKKAFEKNNELTEKIRKSAAEISEKVKLLERNLSLGKEGLKEYRNRAKNKSIVEKESKAYELKCKEIIHKTKNDVDKCNERLKKLKLETEKAAEKSNEIIKKLKAQKGAFSLKNETLTINGDEGLKVYWETYFAGYYDENFPYAGECYQEFIAKVKTLVLKNVSNIYKSEEEIFIDFLELTSVKAENLIGEIGEKAFNGCENLAYFNKANGYDYNISKSVRRVGECAFASAGKNVSNGFSANVKSRVIGQFAFAESGLREINLPNATLIEMGAFKECGKLKKVILGRKRVTFCEYAFDNTPDLTVVVKNEALKDKLKENFYNVKVIIDEE